MKTIVFNHGFNRVEHRQIINIERAKLNHLLNEERRIVENLTKSAQTEIQINPQILRSVEAVWKRIANHRLVREIRRRVDCLTDAYPQFLRHELVELGYLKSAHSLTAESVAFNIQPRKTGQLLIGSSRQFEVEDSAVDNSILTRMLARAIEFLPALAKLSSLRVWTGFRAATPDKLPLIGPAAEHPRLYLATGHEGLGITTSLATAKLLVDQIMNRAPAIPVGPYLLARMELAHA